MYLNRNGWPQSLLGPKLLSKNEIIEQIVCYQVFGEVTSFEDSIVRQRQNLEKAKKDLNDVYSYLNRLDIETDKLYDSYVKWTKKENHLAVKYNKNIEANSKMFKDIIKDLPVEVQNQNYYFINCPKLEIRPILTKTAWLNGEKIHSTHRVTHLKQHIQFQANKIIFNTKQYNKLKNHQMK